MMRALTWHGTNDVRVDTVSDPEIINPRDAIIKITSTAICGSDLHLYDGVIPGVAPGDVLGHEFMGEVVETGSASDLKKGQRVVVPFTISCGGCFHCKQQQYSACDNSNPAEKQDMSATLYGQPMAALFGYSHLTGGYSGGQAEYARVPFSDVGPIVVPDHLEDDKVLFLSDILPTGWMAAENADIQPDDTVAVWGCGPVGLFAIQSAIVMGASKVIAIDHYPNRLALAKQLGAEIIDFREIGLIEIGLVLANDYRVEITSNKQTNNLGSPVFLPVLRASGNVKDGSNQAFHRFRYGLPTANRLLGFDLQITDVGGFELRGEFVRNSQFRRFPNENIIKEQALAKNTADAFYLIAQQRSYPWTLFAEAFSIDADYSTSAFIPNAQGEVFYDNESRHLYEFVDDNDDQDRFPDWRRRGFLPGDAVVFPGWDENNDFISDYNQNDNSDSPNRFPDYDEPFLRFHTDRPEFLYGIDMNHNGTIDRFENDRLADYPYKADHRGYNAHLSANAGPALKLTLGRQRMELISGDGRTEADYALLTLRHLFKGGSAFRFFARGAKVADDIPDNLWLWFQPIGSPDRMREVRDPLSFKDTYKSTLYLDWDLRLGPQVSTFHRFKWDRVEQRETTTDVIGFDGRDLSGFLGVINKAEWSLPVGLAVLEPRWKSEYRRDRPFSTRQPEAESLEETLFLLWTQPLFAETSGVSYFPRFGRQLFDSQLQLGIERSYFWMLDGRREDLEEDFTSWTLLMQLTNRVAYQGYELVTRLGLQMARRNFAESESESSSLFFLTINAGLGE